MEAIMYYRFTYTKYDSKLATFVSLLQANFWIGFSIFFPLLNIPSFIVLAVGSEGGVVGALFAIMTILAIAIEILIMIFAKPHKINERMAKKSSKKKSKQNESRYIPRREREIEYLMPLEDEEENKK